jgi:hypothetical protein
MFALLTLALLFVPPHNSGSADSSDPTGACL